MTFAVTDMSVGVNPELVIEGSGGYHDDAGAFGHLSLTVPFGSPEAMYDLANKLVQSANRWREELMRRAPLPTIRGPYVLQQARKRTPADTVAEADRMATQIAAEVGAADLPATDPKEPHQARDKMLNAIIEAMNNRAVTEGFRMPERQRAWQIALPDEPEVHQMLRGIMLDNLGGISTATPGPAMLSISVAGRDLMHVPLGVDAGQVVRLELRPLTNTAKPPIAPGPVELIPEMPDGELVTYCGTDAARWAAAFIQIALPGNAVTELDVGDMIGWFANAIEETKRRHHCLSCDEHQCPDAPARTE